MFGQQPPSKPLAGENVNDGEKDKNEPAAAIICLVDTQPCATSSPVNINQKTVRYTIRPEEYSIIEDTNAWNPDEAFSESIQLEESSITLPSSSPMSSTSSLSSSPSSMLYLLEMAREMMSNYPTEDELANIIAENFTNYIVELGQQEPPPSSVLPQLQKQQQQQQQQTFNAIDNNVIRLKLPGAQTSCSLEQEKQDDMEQD